MTTMNSIESFLYSASKQDVIPKETQSQTQTTVIATKSIKEIIKKKREFLAKHRKTFAQLLLLSKKHNFQDKLRNIELMVKYLQNDNVSEVSLRLLENYENYLNNLKFNLFPLVLINSVRATLSLPMSAEIFNRTFGAALTSLNGNEYECHGDNPRGFKRVNHSDDDNNSNKLLTLQRELVSLDPKYKLDNRFSRQPLALPLWLFVRLDDVDLPCFPPIVLHIFDHYPDVPAMIVMDPTLWNGSRLFSKVFSIYHDDLPLNCATSIGNSHCQSIQTVLNVWYASIRKAIRTLV